MLKYVVFFITAFIGVPLLCVIGYRMPRLIPYFFLAGLFFLIGEVDINFFSHENYRGSARGISIGLYDLLFVSVGMSLWLSRRLDRRYFLPSGTWLYGLFFLWALVSLRLSDNWLYSSFEIWKLLKGYLFFWVSYHLIGQWRDLNRLVTHLGVVAIWIFLVVLKQKYVDGYFQTPGPFPHQNSMVMFVGVVGHLYFARLLAQNKKQSLSANNASGVNEASILRLARRGFDLLVFIAASFSVYASLSRAGLFIYAAMLSINALGGVFSRFSLKSFIRQLVFLLFFFLAGLATLLKSSDTLIERFSTAPVESGVVRILLAQAAINMASDSWSGVGINNFGLKINPPYPYGSHIPRQSDEEKGGLVETVYLMTAAEMGWIGLSIYGAWLIWYFSQNLLNALRYIDRPELYLCMGLISALLGLYLQSTLEWVLRQTPNYYQLCLLFAIIARMKSLYRRARKECAVSENY